MRALALALALLLGGCADSAFVERVKVKGQAAADAAADANFALLCSNTIGAVGRRNNVNEQHAALLVCWPELYEALGRPPPPIIITPQ